MDAKYWANEAGRFACWLERDLRAGRTDRLEDDYAELCRAVQRLGMRLPTNATRRVA